MTLHPKAVDELYVKRLMSEHYRWWKVFGVRRRACECGAKLGPITIVLYRVYGRWFTVVTVLGRFTLYDGVMRELRRREYT